MDSLWSDVNYNFKYSNLNENKDYKKIKFRTFLTQNLDPRHYLLFRSSVTWKKFSVLGNDFLFKELFLFEENNEALVGWEESRVGKWLADQLMGRSTFSIFV